MFSLSTMTRLRAGRSGDRIPVGAKDLSLLQNVQTDGGAHPVSYSMGTVFFLEDKVDKVDGA